jgi:steroid delta-isomerase-like uncharacterized protein
VRRQPHAPAGPATSAAPAPAITGNGPPSPEEKKVCARHYLEAIDRGDLAALDQTLSPDSATTSRAVPHRSIGRSTGQFLTAFYAACPDLRHSVENMIAAGNRVAARATDRSTQRGELMGIPPTGKAFTITGINIVRIADGRIVEEWVVFDQLGLLQQLGVLPASSQGL